MAACAFLVLPTPVKAATRGPEINHAPPQPRSGDSVRVTADFKTQPRPKQLELQYQIVEPGKYIALNDPGFKSQWTSAKMSDAGENGDQIAGDGIFTAELPPATQKHRRLIRYRIGSPDDKKILAPDPGDAQPNFAYFVYDGVPSWRGAINPRSSDPKLREAVTYPGQALQRVPVYHFISHKASVENATWNERGGFGSNRHEYRYTGTMVYDGIVYDHVKFRARGGVWRHAMGKNMWKFNFLGGHRFRARDNYGIPYDAKWDKLNLGACIQQGDFGMRGEQGMFEAVGYRLFNLAGTEGPRTHWVHLRIITHAEESAADQYGGDFWGLYLATENVDEHFLKEHDLPAGNVYKIEGYQGKLAFNGNPSVANGSDVNAFVRATMQRQQPDAWWSQNVDLPRYYNYRAIVECIHHYDIDAGKNYFYYLNHSTRKWIAIPWDVDLTWGDHMHGGGADPFFRTGLLSRSPFKQQYQDRLAEIRDLLFNPEQINLLIDEHAAMISDPTGLLSIVDADRAKWDFHPVLASGRVMPSKAGHGRFYFGDPRNTFQSMVQYMKSYAAKRMAWIDRRLLSDFQPPPSPKIAAAGPAKFRIESKIEGNGSGFCRWRLAEVTDPKSPSFNRREPWKYEITALWEKELKSDLALEVPVNLLKPGRVYRVRARGQDTNGAWSRWSSPMQFTAP
ncbi:MAG: CotH kinase family protein [Verrucomicrobia bacterium]|nr:CotH kinase family protein [Verrucomicrobiota bacterium]